MTSSNPSADGGQTASGQGQQSVQLKVSEDQQAGVFANAASVTVSGDSVVCDFGYIIPNVKPVTIKVVSRVNLTHKTTESFLKVLQNAVLDWRNKQKEFEKSEKQ
ncbi:MAG: hypothetical protein UT55_C0014G0006 [Candidatus Peregrinibacteria bacterium GW2011_GWE2_39_6]|nr:MAG: hypothetical protein UT36_C0008G0051 [Candidatus Peregrinibacteria bacterium GW2011_GWF2_39_17]KKR26205.1 MAG: hypothetical protein UT55_C0014G0006 [Candidatus Peregrinibacteria bacterium GW2011_GWE2_39_6]HCW32090.1 hypothetical protein [Candidatus Peregrinibacteria bacterium]